MVFWKQGYTMHKSIFRKKIWNKWYMDKCNNNIPGFNNKTTHLP